MTRRLILSKLWYIPIEPLAERYTEQWYNEFPVLFKQYGMDEVKVIDGAPLTNFVKVGAFLDMNSTVHYKNTQMQQISAAFNNGEVNAGDIFFIADLEYWGIEAIRLMSQLNNVPVKLFGWLHAASFTKEDAFSVAAPYQKYIEIGWCSAMDGVFVGSQYQKDAFYERRIAPLVSSVEEQNELMNKIHPVGNPLFMNVYEKEQHYSFNKKKQLIISNRFDYEKRPNESLQFAYLLKKRVPDLEIIVTTSRPKFKSNKQWLVNLALGMQEDGIIKIYEGLTKSEYHRHLAESKLMLTNSIEESFGYCIAEALAFGTNVLAPNHCSHPELLCGDSRMLFDNADEIVEKAVVLLDTNIDTRYYITKYEAKSVISSMVSIMKGSK